MVLVDTSVWVDFLRARSDPPWRDHLAGLLRRDEVSIVAPVAAELLYGVRGERERRVVLELAGAVRHAPLDASTWLAAGDLGRSWRERGRTLSLVDALLVVVARRDGTPLWSLDGDFDALEQAGEVVRYRA